jgi:GAF domain-containing protein
MSEEFDRRLELMVTVLATHRSLPARLEAVAAIARRLTPGCDAASVAMILEGVPTTAAISDSIAMEVDLVQYTQEEGPCLTAVGGPHPIRIDVLADDERFPRFAAGATELGVNSVLSLPLLAGDVVVGSLNMYGFSERAFDDATGETLRPLLEYAAEAIAASPLYEMATDVVDEAVHVLVDRSVIAQAIGALMHAHRLLPTQAFDLLEDRARLHRETVREAADRILGELRQTRDAGSDEP